MTGVADSSTQIPQIPYGVIKLNAGVKHVIECSSSSRTPESADSFAQKRWEESTGAGPIKQKAFVAMSDLLHLDPVERNQWSESISRNLKVWNPDGANAFLGSVGYYLFVHCPEKAVVYQDAPQHAATAHVSLEIGLNSFKSNGGGVAWISDPNWMRRHALLNAYVSLSYDSSTLGWGTPEI